MLPTRREHSVFWGISAARNWYSHAEEWANAGSISALRDPASTLEGDLGKQARTLAVVELNVGKMSPLVLV